MIEATENAAPAITSEEIAQLTAEFLAKGCEIAVLKHGESAFVDGVRAPSTPERKAREARTEAIRRRTRKADAADVERLRKALAEKRYDIRHEFGKDRLKRLIQVYLKDEPGVENLQPTNLAEVERRKKQIADKLLEAVAKGITGHQNMADYAGVSLTTVVRLKREFKLDLPRRPPYFSKDYKKVAK